MNSPTKSCLGLATAFAFSLVASIATAEDKDVPDSYLFVQNAESVEFSDNHMTLNGLDNKLIIFSDRPKRVAAVISNQTFAKLWAEGPDSFAADPPNAVVIGEVDGAMKSVVVELMKPEFSDGTVTYEFVLLEGSTPTEFGQPYVVIDSDSTIYENMKILLNSHP